MSMTSLFSFSGTNDFFVFSGKFILVEENADKTPQAFTETAGTPPALFRQAIDKGLVSDSFSETGYNYSAALLSSSEKLPEGSMLIPLRHFFAAGNPLSAKAARALGIANWRAATRFCSRCGAPLKDDSRETARLCTRCNAVVYPRISPCIIILISRPCADGSGREMLLARHVQRNQTMYTCIAGFMEAGESVEECAAREVREETGLEIKNIKYFKSQSWPFPEQLMIGLTADYADGELKLQEDELSEAGWFKPDALPETPPAGSLAWDLIKTCK